VEEEEGMWNQEMAAAAAVMHTSQCLPHLLPTKKASFPAAGARWQPPPRRRRRLLVVVLVVMVVG
jgi:hypothetical protein